MLEQRQTERVYDTVRQTVLVTDTLCEQLTVRDTLRETTTITLNAEGDTTSRTTEREHISDRTRERSTATQQLATTESSHREDREVAISEEKETAVGQPEAKWGWAFQWGVVAGLLCGIINTLGTLRLIKLIRKFRK